MKEKIVNVLVEGGSASSTGSLAPMLIPLGLNMVAVVKKINEVTSEFKGLKVPVKIIVNMETKEFEVEVGVPSTSALVLKEAGIEKGASTTGRQVAGDLTFEQVLKIAKILSKKSYSTTLQSVVKEVLGTCSSMGITVDGRSPKKVLQEVNEGLRRV